MCHTGLVVSLVVCVRCAGAGLVLLSSARDYLGVGAIMLAWSRAGHALPQTAFTCQKMGGRCDHKPEFTRCCSRGVLFDGWLAASDEWKMRRFVDSAPFSVACLVPVFALYCTGLYCTPLLCCVCFFQHYCHCHYHHPLLQYSTPRLTSPRLRMRRGSKTI
jgi:hypothetical protein